jgi:hypothetical protein
MDKRSALVTAGGLAASFVAGIAAVSFDWGIIGSSPSADVASAAQSSARPEPIVKHRTIVVHRKAPTRGASPPVARTTSPHPVTVAPPAPVAMTSGSHSGQGNDEGDDGSADEREGSE